MITQNMSISAEYGLLQTVSASKTFKGGSSTSPTNCTISFANLTGNVADISALSSVFSNAFALTVGGLALTALSAVLIFVSGFRKPTLISYVKFTGIIAAIVLVAASIYFWAEMPPVISKLTNVIPAEISNLSGKVVNGFWGSWKQWIWGPAFGWFLTFTAFLLNAATFMLVHTLYSKKVKET